MMLDTTALYEALKSRDPRFDGRFFVGVSSTRIYCRPVCTAKLPKRENCAFFAHAAAAEQAGYRPCLRCRPELAPGNATVDASQRLALAAAGLIEDGFLTDGSFVDLASHLGVTDRHLRRTFQAAFGVAPVGFLQTQRLLMAKSLLTDTAMPITDVAMAAGFGSLRRFNALFHERYRMKPGDVRRANGTVAPADHLRFELTYRPPYAWKAMLEFLARRALSGIEVVTEKAYARTVALETGGRRLTGWIQVEQMPGKNALQVAVAASLAPVLPRVLGRIKAMFDLSCQPAEVAAHLGRLARGTPGLRVPGTFDGFELALRAILGQQVSVASARTLVQRVASEFGAPLEPARDGLSRLFPEPQVIAAATPARLGRLGIVRSRVAAIQALAGALSTGALRLDQSVDVEQTVAKLQAMPGIGSWTAQYIAMRALSWPDAFPHTDHAVKTALREEKPAMVLAQAAPWRPWRAYAVMHLWQSLAKEVAP